MFRDTDEMEEFLGSDARLVPARVGLPGAALPEGDLREDEIFALNIFSGRLLAYKGRVLPVIGDRISLHICAEYRPLRYKESVLAADLAPAGDLENALFVAGSSSYYHFLAFHFCSLFLLRAMPQDRKVILATLAGFPPAMNDVLAELIPQLAGCRPVEIHRIGDGQYNLRNILYALPTRTGPASLACTHFIVPTVLERMRRQGRLPAQTPAKIFVRREGAGNGRNLLNQADIEALIEKRGYVSVNPGALSFEDQIVLFARATHIVGVEGGAMANMFFAVGAVEIVLIASPLVATDAFFSDIAKTAAYAFRVVAGEVAPGKPADRSADYVLPGARLVKALGA